MTNGWHWSVTMARASMPSEFADWFWIRKFEPHPSCKIAFNIESVLHWARHEASSTSATRLCLIESFPNHGDRGATGWGLFLPALKKRGKTVEPRSPWSPDGDSGYSFSNHHGRKGQSRQMGGTGQGRWFVRQCPVSLPTDFAYANSNPSRPVKSRPELSQCFTGRGTIHPRPVPPIFPQF